MKYGVCGGPDVARVAKKAGFDYFEWSVGSLLRPREDEQAFKAALKEARDVGLPCPAANVFIPADLKITGPAVDQKALEAFVATALRRAEIAGVETIVFGSGGARNIPEGFERETAWQQLVGFCQMLGETAMHHNVTIAVEPLNKSESNVINTVGEGAELVRQVDHPNICLLADGYHWGKDHDTVEAIVENGGLLVHAHVATVEGRHPPRASDTCAPFFTALMQAGYDGRVSFEGVLENPEEELPHALEIMRRAT
jgi:D-psicose/D-tagatose/L-ribulose 3-epimerase